MSDTTFILNQKQLKSFLNRLGQSEEIAIWLSTSPQSSNLAAIDCIGILTKSGESFCIPFQDSLPKEEIKLETEEVLAELGPYLSRSSLRIMGQELKKVIKVFKAYGIDLANIAFDTQLASYLLEPNKDDFSLPAIAKRFLSAEVGQSENAADSSAPPICRKCAENAEIIIELSQVLKPKLQDNGLLDLFNRVEMPLIEVLAEMEQNGIKLDVDKIKALAGELEEDKQDIEQEIDHLAGEEINPNSPQQVGYILFEKLNLPVIEKTKTGPSTNARVLSELSSQHPLPAQILKFRELSKLLNTYIEKLPEFVNPRTGRIHTTFNQSTAATGRLSSSDPNLQNIPVRTEIGKKIREAFVAPEGKKLLGADYSQIELRLLAHLSGDQEMIKAFREGKDLHNITAREIFDVEQDEVNGRMRDVAKRVNFGIPYGISSFRLGKELGITTEEADRFINRYFRRYLKVKKFIEKLVEEAEEKGYVTTILNRKRPLPFINSSNYHKRSYDQRNAINTPLQGSAADLIKLAMLDIHQKIKEGILKGGLLLQVHDELIFELDENEVGPAGEEIKESMESVFELEVPIIVDIKVGDNWGEI